MLPVCYLPCPPYRTGPTYATGPRSARVNALGPPRFARDPNCNPNRNPNPNPNPRREGEDLKMSSGVLVRSIRSKMVTELNGGPVPASSRVSASSCPSSSPPCGLLVFLAAWLEPPSASLACRSWVWVSQLLLFGSFCVWNSESGAKGGPKGSKWG